MQTLLETAVFIGVFAGFVYLSSTMALNTEKSKKSESFEFKKAKDVT